MLTLSFCLRKKPCLCRPAQVVLMGECLHVFPSAAPVPENPTPAEAAAAGHTHLVSIDPQTGAGFTLNNPGVGQGSSWLHL